MDIQKEKLKLVDAGLIVSTIILGTIILSIFIGYNARKKLVGEETYWSDAEALTIAIAIKAIILATAIINVFLNNKTMDLLKAENEDKKTLDNETLEIIAGWLILIGAILVLIATIDANKENTLLEISNPEL